MDSEPGFGLESSLQKPGYNAASFPTHFSLSLPARDVREQFPLTGMDFSKEVMRIHHSLRNRSVGTIALDQIKTLWAV